MKKIAILTLVLILILSLVACNDKGGTTPENTTAASTTASSTTAETTPPEEPTPEITLQEVYDAGKDLTALLGNHENVYVQVTSNGKVIREEYLSNQYYYSFYSAEYMDMGFEYMGFATDTAEYFYIDNIYALNLALDPNGIVKTTDSLSIMGSISFISTEVLNDNSGSITEKDGVITVTCTADVDEIVIIDNDVVSCVEIYTLDAKTREMTSVKTVYTYKDGTVEEGIATITRDVEPLESMKPFIAYAQETENMRTVTIVSNPGTENEKTETVQVAKGLYFGFTPNIGVDKTFTQYADAACTEEFDEELDANSDVTVYIKWEE